MSDINVRGEKVFVGGGAGDKTLSLESNKVPIPPLPALAVPVGRLILHFANNMSGADNEFMNVNLWDEESFILALLKQSSTVSKSC